MISETPEMRQSASANQSFGWGDSCFYQPNRSGICFFRVKHFLALQSFSSLSISFIDRIAPCITIELPESTVYANIHSEKDGVIAGSVSESVLKTLKSLGRNASRW